MATPVVRDLGSAGAEPASSPSVRRVWLVATAALVIAYAALSHYSASSSDAKGLGAALSIGPVFLISLLLLWRWTKPLTAVLAAALLGIGLFRFWPVVKNNYEWADLVQQCGIYGLVAVSFARSLSASRVPLCTQLAIKIHSPLTTIEIDYYRRATVAWATFYMLIAAAILIIFFVASIRVWSFFVNFGTFALIILMGILDHGIRRRLLPRHQGGSILAIIRGSIIG